MERQGSDIVAEENLVPGFTGYRVEAQRLAKRQIEGKWLVNVAVLE